MMEKPETRVTVGTRHKTKTNKTKQKTLSLWM